MTRRVIQMTRRVIQKNRDSEHGAREKCLRLLALRPRSAAELRQRLCKDDYNAEVTEAVVAALQEVGLVDDREFARSWIASRQAGGGASRRRLAWELRRKGVPEALIRELVVDSIDDEAETEQARQLARRRMPPETADQRAYQRLRELLLRRGFEYGTVQVVMRELSTVEEH